MIKDNEEILRKRWKSLCDKNYQSIGDVGSCVLGAGLAENGFMLISSWDVCKCQGNMTWETGLQELILEFNQEFNSNVYYEVGVMD